MTHALSAIDTCWPGDLPELVPALDELGYSRFWTTEHHGPRQSASPMMAAAIAAGLCSNMRVGTAGVLLSLHNPLRVAEDARLMDVCHPGRFDLGVAGAVPKGPHADALLEGRGPDGLPSYRDKVEQLVALMAGHSEVVAGPIDPRVPLRTARVWMCGTSEGSARLAAELGCNYAFHHYLARPGIDGPAAVQAYRDAWHDHHAGPCGEVVVAAYGLCAPTDEAANTLWEQAFGPIEPSHNRPQPTFIGNPDTCREALAGLRRAYGVDEIVVQSLASSVLARIRSYTLLAA